MKIAVVGGGFTGLTCAYRLRRAGHEVSVFEKEERPGGLAIGVKDNSWKWTLEEHYHHWFTNDKAVLNLANEIGHKVYVRRPSTAIWLENRIFPFDSPSRVFSFPLLDFGERFRMVCALGLIRYNPWWKLLENFNAADFLPKIMGEKAYKMIWEPQFEHKFGKWAKDVSMAWFWARINKRTADLAYPEGGFLRFAERLSGKISDLGGRFFWGAETVSIGQKNCVVLRVREKKGVERELNFDAAIVTVPTFVFLKIGIDLPDKYKSKLAKLRGLGAVNLVLRLRKPFLPNKTYWLSVCDENAPMMAIVEHTNFMDKRFYNNEHIVYVGNYIESMSQEYNLSKQALLEKYDSYLKKLNPGYRQELIDYDVHKAFFAQPVVPPGYSKIIPSMQTPLRNVYLANMEQVYPWDRGTNYAVELGERVAGLI